MLWGTGGIVVRILHDQTGLSGVAIAFYRLMVGAAVLLVACARHSHELRSALRTAPALLATIGTGLAAY
jgi:drug/metabolite transporter (DMT)-like permease